MLIEIVKEMENTKRAEIQRIAEHHGVSFRLCADIMMHGFLMDSKTKLSDTDFQDAKILIDESFARFKNLERKADRYDLLIGEEKAKAEEMAGK